MEVQCRWGMQENECPVVCHHGRASTPSVAASGSGSSDSIAGWGDKKSWCLGGDDVQQLMEVAEEEFLEIMALVGMAQKPLHVRRLQKALQEVAANPARFNYLALQLQAAAGQPPGFVFPGPLVPTAPAPPGPSRPPTDLADITRPRPGAALLHHRRQPPVPPASLPSPPSRRPAPRQSTVSPQMHQSPQPVFPNAGPGPAFTPEPSGSPPPPAQEVSTPKPSSPQLPAPPGDQPSGESSGLGRSEGGTDGTSDFEYGADGSIIGPNPGLSDEQMEKLRSISERIVQNLPEFLPKMIQNKKKISSSLLELINMQPGGPLEHDRIARFRRYAAIYARFDSKRRAEKKLTLHEVSVNEAATQICLLRPALLTRREELFPLARKVVKDAGYHYAKQPSKRSAEDDSDRPRKRGTPAESIGSSDGGRATPESSSAAGSPPITASAPLPSSSNAATARLLFQQHHHLAAGFGPGTSGLHALTIASSHLAAQMQAGSPSSSSTSVGSVPSLHLPFSAAQPPPVTAAPGMPLPFPQSFAASTAEYLSRHRGLSRGELMEKSELVKGGLIRLAEKQKSTERRIMVASDTSAFISTNTELKNLAVRQVELLNEQAALEELIAAAPKPEPPPPPPQPPPSLPPPPALAEASKTNGRRSERSGEEEEPGSGGGIGGSGGSGGSGETVSGEECGEEEGELEVGTHHPPTPPASHIPGAPSSPRVTRLASKRERL